MRMYSQRSTLRRVLSGISILLMTSDLIGIIEKAVFFVWQNPVSEVVGIAISLVRLGLCTSLVIKRPESPELLSLLNTNDNERQQPAFHHITSSRSSVHSASHYTSRYENLWTSCKASISQFFSDIRRSAKALVSYVFLFLM